MLRIAPYRTGMLLVICAVPFWVLLLILVPRSPGFGGGSWRYWVAPLVLCGTTAAIHRLVRGTPHAWALSILLAGAGTAGVLVVASLF